MQMLQTWYSKFSIVIGSIGIIGMCVYRLMKLNTLDFAAA